MVGKGGVKIECMVLAQVEFIPADLRFNNTIQNKDKLFRTHRILFYVRLAARTLHPTSG